MLSRSCIEIERWILENLDEDDDENDIIHLSHEKINEDHFLILAKHSQ
jgi:hypothetical protein